MLIQIFVFIVLASVGLFLLLRIPAGDFLTGWKRLLRHDRSTKKRRREILTGKRQESRILRYFKESRNILAQTGRAELFPFVEIGALVLAGAGVLLGLILNNPVLAAVLAVCLFFAPFQAVHALEKNLEASFMRNMKSSLGVITSTYIQTDDIQSSVEKNLGLLKEPYHGVFRDFVTELRTIEVHTPRAIQTMMEKVDHPLFREWCSVLIQCHDNKELKYVLPVVVDKIDETITVQAETDTRTNPEIDHFNTMFIISLASFPLMALISNSWYAALASNPIGKIIIAASVGLCFAMLGVAVKTMAPIRHR